MRALLQAALGDELPFVIAAPVALFCALMWGAGAGALTTAVCLAGTLLPWLPPDVLNVAGGLKALAFAVTMTAACVLIARVDAARHRAENIEDGVQTPLVRWLNAALFSAVLVPATALVLVGWWTYDRTTRSNQETAVQRADLIYKHARRTFDSAEQLAVSAAALTQGDDARIRAHEDDSRQRLSDMVLGMPSVVNINVWDAQAVPLARSDRVVDPSASVADRDYFLRQAAKDRGFDVSQVLVGRQTGKELFNLTCRRQTADGAFNGIVAVSLSPEYFRDYYRAVVAQNAEVESISLVRTDGLILARWPALTDGAVSLPASSPSLLAVQEGQASGVIAGRHPTTGERRIGAYRRIEKLPVYVVVGFSQAAMLAGWIRTVGIVVAITLPITLLLIAVTAIARRRVKSEQQIQRELHEQTRLRAASEKSALEAHRRETLAALTAGVAHDFNNLLAILSNSLHIQHIRHPERAAEPQSAAMRRAIQSGTRLTRQLLSFTRRQPLKPEVIDLQSWLPGMQELLRTTLGSRIKLSVHVDAGTPPVLVDAAELELALVNLAVNSKHAQPNGGSFALTVHAGMQNDARRVHICARDEGAGIPREILARVTEPFFTTKEAGSGSGLGLSQVRGVADAAGGELHIDSEVGRGTAVTLMLPAFEAMTADAVEAPDGSRALLECKFEGHVLVAEDNDDVATVTTTLLASLGLRVTRASSGAEALALLRNPQSGKDFGFLLTDVVMPGEMDGVALAIQLRAERPGLPVTVVTGYAENVQAALDAQLDVMQKPLALDALAARLHRAFQPKA